MLFRNNKTKEILPIDEWGGFANWWAILVEDGHLKDVRWGQDNIHPDSAYYFAPHDLPKGNWEVYHEHEYEAFIKRMKALGWEYLENWYACRECGKYTNAGLHIQRGLSFPCVCEDCFRTWLAKKKKQAEDLKQNLKSNP